MNKEKLRKLWNHRGYQLAMEGNYEQAIKCFEKALKINKDDKIALLNKANALSKLLKHSDALKAIEIILRNDPEDLDALTTKSLILRDLGDPKRGFDIINRVLKRIPNDIIALANKVMLLNELGKHQEVLKISEKILSQDPNHIETLINRGAAFNSLKQYDEALKIYNTVLKKNSNFVPALVNKGILLSKTGDSEGAIKYYDKALLLDPENPLILGNKANDLDLLGKTGEALSCLDKALEIDPNKDFLLLNKAGILNNATKYTKALEILQKLECLHPNYPHTYTHLGVLYVNLNEYQKALEHLKKSKELLKNDKRIIEVNKYIDIVNNLIRISNQIKIIDEKFIDLIDTENWIELRNYNVIFYQQFELIINDCNNFDISDDVLELLDAKKRCIKILNLILNKLSIPSDRFDDIRNVFKKYKLDDYIHVLNIIENIHIEIEKYGSWDTYLSEKKRKIQTQFRNILLLDGSFTEIIFKKLEYRQSTIPDLLPSKTFAISSIKGKRLEDIKIFHISDLHFGIEHSKETSKGELIKRKTTISKLIMDVKDYLLKNPEWKPDILVITGDIGFAGINNDYKLAKKWLKKLISVLKIPQENVITCVGNHDRYIGEIERFHPKNIEESDNLWYKNYEDTFKGFINFSEAFLEPFVLNNQKAYLSGYRDIMGIKFLVLNSARYAHGKNEDRGNLFLGWPDVNLMIDENLLPEPKNLKYSNITIALFHHPREWLHNEVINEFKGHTATYNFLAQRCHIILSGHIHAEKVGQPQRYGNASLHFSIGAIYLRQDYINNCAIYKIELNSRKISRLIIDFDPSKLKWIANESEIENYDLIN
jgi:tetratricopeptide (TPR) repeat protein